MFHVNILKYKSNVFETSPAVVISKFKCQYIFIYTHTYMYASIQLLNI